MSANKMGSKLAQGVRQIMEKQVKSPEATENVVAPQVAAVKAPSASVTKATSAQVINDAQMEQPINSSGILHPSRVWPD